MVYCINMDTKWEVVVSKKVQKQFGKLPPKIQDIVLTLIKDLEFYGPVRGRWPHFGWLEKIKAYHCHLKKGHPTYVACWKVDKRSSRVEVVYVGTHEKAPY